MKAGRNDPCPCGSGKKYKKCCFARDQENATRQTAVVPPSPLTIARSGPSLAQQHPKPATPAVPVDPITERANSLWEKFKSSSGEERIAVYFATLDDAEVIEDDLAFEMLRTLYSETVINGDRTRLAECVGALRERRPEVFEASGHYYISWCLRNALAEGRSEVVPEFARELATPSAATSTSSTVLPKS